MAAGRKRAGRAALPAGSVRIEFLRPYVVKDAERATYAAGDVLVCSAASADHFVRRGAARVKTDEEIAPDVDPDASPDRTAGD